MNETIENEVLEINSWNDFENKVFKNYNKEEIIAFSNNDDLDLTQFFKYNKIVINLSSHQMSDTVYGNIPFQYKKLFIKIFEDKKINKIVKGDFINTALNLREFNNSEFEKFSLTKNIGKYSFTECFFGDFSVKDFSSLIFEGGIIDSNNFFLFSNESNSEIAIHGVNIKRMFFGSRDINLPFKVDVLKILWSGIKNLKIFNYSVSRDIIIDYNTRIGRNDSIEITQMNPEKISITSYIKRIPIRKILLDDVQMNKEGILYQLKNLKIEVLEIKNITNLSDRFILQNLEIKHLIIKNCHMGTAVLDDLKIDKLTLKSVILKDCIINNVTFPPNYKLEEINKIKDGKKTEEINYKLMKDIYRQLKFVMDQNGNKTEANRFFEKEMEYYREEIKDKRILIWKTFKDAFEQNFSGESLKYLSERIVLDFGYQISDFGNNWIRTAFLILLFVFLSTSIVVVIRYYDNINNIISDEFIGLSSIILRLVLLVVIGIIIKFIRLITRFKKVKYIFVLLASIFLMRMDGFLEIFVNLLSPVYGFKELSNSYWFLLFLMLYKLIYGIMLWHLGVAIKRTTRR